MNKSRPSLAVSLAVLTLLLLPPLIFYTMLFRTVINLPFGDDYDILQFLSHFCDLHGIGPKLLDLVTSQHNEYKLMFGHAIFVLQYIVLGHVSFSGLCIIGDVSIVLLAITLWIMFLPQQSNRSLRTALFVPVPWLLFQLSYSETLNWAEPALQNLYIFVFSFACFIFLTRKTAAQFSCALLSLVLAVAASGNGFITAFVGALVLLNRRRFGRLLIWVVVTAGMMALYAYKYNVMSSQVQAHRSIFATLLHLRVTYILSFLGSVGVLAHSALHPLSVTRACLALGILLCCAFLFAASQKKLSSNPSVNAALLFIVLTAVGVAGIRSEFGIMQSISSRYRLYSTLMLILAWFLICEHSLQNLGKPLRSSWIFRAGCVSAVLFCLAADRDGIRFVKVRNAVTIQGMALYEHPACARPEEGPVFTGPPHAIFFPESVKQEDRIALKEAEEKGIYDPPNY